MNKFTWLSPLFNAEGDIGAESISVEGSEIAAEQTQETPIETPTEDVTKQESFAKRLKESTEKAIAEEKAKWEQEVNPKLSYLEKQAKLYGYSTVDEYTIALDDHLEQQALASEAEKENLTVEELQAKKEIDDLKAFKNQTLAQQQQQLATQQFEDTLKEFCKDKDVDHTELWKFMHENQVANPEIALRAMRAEEIEKRANEKEAETIKRYLATKSAPKVEGSTGAAASQSVETKNMSWDQINKHATERINAMNTPQ